MVDQSSNQFWLLLLGADSAAAAADDVVVVVRFGWLFFASPHLTVDSGDTMQKYTEWSVCCVRDTEKVLGNGNNSRNSAQQERRWRTTGKSV